jgi:hypothetical protein
MIIDGETVVTGSFNFTKAAEENNAENLLMIRDKKLASAYTKNCLEHEGHTGYRAYGRKVLEHIPYHKNSDGFVFDAQFLIQAAYFGFRMGDLPVPCRYMREASSINLSRSIVYGIGTVKTLFQFILQRLHLVNLGLFRS